MASTERTPLLQPLQPPNHNNHGNGQARAHDENTAKTEMTERSQTNKLWSFLSSPEQRILFAGFLVSLILGLTQVPIIYLFRVMSCEAFYAHEDQHSHDFDMGAAAAAASTTADRCARREIDAATAQQVSIVGMTTSVCGIINLFICGSLIRKLGPRWALVSQTSLLAVRVAIQILGVRVGGRMGIVTVQVAQVVGIVGGPRGYMLVLNTSVAEVVERRKHTGVFGKLQGAIMIGTAVGYLLGGVLGDVFGIASPFEFAVGGFLASTIYAALFMPETDSQDAGSVAEANRNKAPTGFLAPIKILMPPKFRLESGRVVKHYGLAILAFGVFFGVFATGYAPILIQMYATSRFNFATTENGILMSGNSLIRGVFLMFIFPHLIDAGRRWFAKSSTPTHAHFDHEQERLIQESGEVLPANPDEVEPVPGLMNAEEPTKPHPEEEDEDSTFDLFFLRWSLVVDGVVTSISAWATQGWHMYLAAFLLPFASGSAPAAKGVITEMCPSYLRQDALSAITLVESAATLTTQGLFGLIYASLAATGQGNLTFFCNGGLAMIAVAILCLAHYPPANSTRVDELEDDHDHHDDNDDEGDGEGEGENEEESENVENERT